MEQEKTFAWQYIGDGDNAFMEQDNSPKLTLWQSVRNSKDRNTIGALAISVDVRKLLAAGPRLGPAYRSMILLNEKNEEVFNRTGIPLGRDDIAMLNDLSPTVDHRVLIGGVEYWAFISRVANTNLKLVYLLARRGIPWDINSFAVFTIVAVGLFTLLLYPLFLFITKSVIKPLKKLMMAMEGFSRGDSTSRVDFRYSDEVGRLGKVFNAMVRENQRLISSNYVLKLKEKEAELAYLQSQINPHFLNNVINSIQWLAVKNGDDEVADLILTLGKMFRSSLGHKRKKSTVRQEIELLNNYLKLQKQCFGSRFDYSISIQDGVGEMNIPRLSIQPLVENSILHGVEKSFSKVCILVHVYLSADEKMIHIEVSDDGPGIAPEILALLPDTYQSADADGGSRGNKLALKNISDRLKIRYDDQYSFVIESTPYVETIVKITIPVASAPHSAIEKDVRGNV